MIFIDETKTAAQEASSSPDSDLEDLEPWESPKSSPSNHANNQRLPPNHETQAITLRPQQSPCDRPLPPAIPPVPSTPTWPLTHERDVFLFRHFVDKLASWVPYPTIPLLDRVVCV